MRKLMTVTAFSALLAVFAVNVTMADKEEDKKKEKKPMSIHDVMEKGFKGGKSLYSKIKSTKKKSTKEEQEKFLSMLKDMAKSKPPMGDEKSWKKFTTAMIKPMEKIVKGEDVDKNKKALTKAGSCAKCHKAHRPKKKRD